MLNSTFANRSSTDHRVRQEVSIRTLSVSLLAVAAIAASLLLTRSREDQVAPADERVAGQSLDEIRAAGL